MQGVKWGASRCSVQGRPETHCPGLLSAAPRALVNEKAHLPSLPALNRAPPGDSHGQRDARSSLIGRQHHCFPVRPGLRVPTLRAGSGHLAALTRGLAMKIHTAPQGTLQAAPGPTQLPPPRSLSRMLSFHNTHSEFPEGCRL